MFYLIILTIFIKKIVALSYGQQKNYNYFLGFILDHQVGKNIYSYTKYDLYLK